MPGSVSQRAADVGLCSPASAVLWEPMAFVLFVAASRAIGRGRALVATVVWCFPVAITWLLGTPADFSELSTEYLPMLLFMASALVPASSWR